MKIFFNSLFMLICLSLYMPRAFALSSKRCLPPEACYQKAVSIINKITNERLSHITHKRNNYQFFLTGKRAKIAVVTIHGNFEAPRSIKGISKFFHNDLNANVLSVLLPGFWETPMEKLDEISHKEWLKEIDRAIKIASLLGDKVIVFGHSLGGVLALYAGFKYPQDVDIVFASAPALQQNSKISTAAFFANLCGISGNEYYGIRGDNGYSVPYFSPKTSFFINDVVEQIKEDFGIGTYSEEDHGTDSDNEEGYSFIDREFDFLKYKVPTMFFVSEADTIISTEAVKEFYKKIKVTKNILIYKNMPHDTINKGRGDSRHYNSGFKHLTKKIYDFTVKTLGLRP